MSPSAPRLAPSAPRLCLRCMHLAFPLEKAPILPPCFCLSTMRDSVRGWLLERRRSPDPILGAFQQMEWRNSILDMINAQLESLSPARAGRDFAERYCGPSRSVSEEERTRNASLLREGELHDVFTALYNQWPLSMGDRYLGGVIREWVEGQANEALAVGLADHTEWRKHLEATRREYSEWCTQTLEATTGQWMQQVGTAGAALSQPRAAALTADGLPSNPAIMRHLWGLAAGLRDWLPAFGLLITTRVFVRPDGERWEVESLCDSTQSGDTTFVTTGLTEPAGKVMRRHRDFIKRLHPHPLTEVSAIRRSYGAKSNLYRELPDDPFSFEDDALAPKHLAPLLETLYRQPHRRDLEIQKYLDRSQRRVQGRRRTHRQGTATPPGWRASMIAEINRYLAAYSQNQP